MGTKEEQVESMYFFLDDDGELKGPYSREDLEDEIADIDSGYWEEMSAFVVSYKDGMLVFQDIGIDQEPRVDLTVSPRETTL